MGANDQVPANVPPKSVAVAYLLWFFLGWLGIHRFYLARTGSAILMLLLVLAAGFFTLIPIIGLVAAVPLGLAWLVWWLVDALLIPKLARGA